MLHSLILHLSISLQQVIIKSPLALWTQPHPGDSVSSRWGEKQRDTNHLLCVWVCNNS